MEIDSDGYIKLSSLTRVATRFIEIWPSRKKEAVLSPIPMSKRLRCCRPLQAHALFPVRTEMIIKIEKKRKKMINTSAKEKYKVFPVIARLQVQSDRLLRKTSAVKHSKITSSSK